MRVLMVSSLWPPVALGGAELYAASLADQLARRGYQVGVLTLGVDGPGVLAAARPWPYRLDGYSTQSPLRRILFQAHDLVAREPARLLARVISEWRPDVVHSHVVTGMSARVLARPASVRVAHVHSLHDYWLICRRSALMRRGGRSCERDCFTCRSISQTRRLAVAKNGPHLVIAPSRAVAEEHRQRGWFTDRLVVIPHPVSPQPVTRREVTGQPVRFGYLGALTPEKGVLQLLKAYEHVARELPCQLVVAGRGPLAAVVQRRADKFFGWLERGGKEAFWDAIDCLIVPSVWREPFSLVVNEAAERGIPVIASAIGGIPEVVAETCRPLLCAPGDAAALADAMLRFAREPFRYQPATRKHPTWEEHLAAVTDCYAEARARAGGGHAS
jgi:glycogen(starch) synthase